MRREITKLQSYYEVETQEGKTVFIPQELADQNGLDEDAILDMEGVIEVTLSRGYGCKINDITQIVFPTREECENWFAVQTKTPREILGVYEEEK